MSIYPTGRGKAANIEGKGQVPLTPYLTLPCNQKNGHSEVPMADIDSKIQRLFVPTEVDGLSQMNRYLDNTQNRTR